MIFELAQDFYDAIAVMPKGHPWHRILELLEEAIRRDINLIARHPTTLFQCLWNTCWWYDCPEAAEHYEKLDGGWLPREPPWNHPGPKLVQLLQDWRSGKEKATPASLWLRSIRPPPMHLNSPQRAVLSGHENGVMSVAYSKDGRFIVSASRDGSLRIWDAVAGRELLCLHGHDKGVTSAAFSPDGRFIASGSGDCTVRVWDATTGTELRCLRGHERHVTSVGYSPDGRWIVTGSSDWTVRIWDAETGHELHCLRRHSDHVSSVAWSPNGRHVVSGSDDNKLRVWDIYNCAERLCLQGHQFGVTAVAYSPDGCRIASASKDRTIRIWDAETGRELCCLRGHSDDIQSVTWSPDGQRIASGSGGTDSRRRDCTVRVWDTSSGKELLCFRGHCDFVNCVVFSPDGRHVASASGGGPGTQFRRDFVIRIWDVQQVRPQFCLLGGTELITCVAYSSNGDFIATGTPFGEAQIWAANDGRMLRTIRVNPWDIPVLMLKFLDDGRRIASGSNDLKTWVIDVETGKCVKLLEGVVSFSEISTDICSFQAKCIGQETLVYRGTTGSVAGWYPAALGLPQLLALNVPAKSPRGHTWAGSQANYLFIITLEGWPESRR